MKHTNTRQIKMRKFYIIIFLAYLSCNPMGQSQEEKYSSMVQSQEEIWNSIGQSKEEKYSNMYIGRADKLIVRDRQADRVKLQSYLSENNFHCIENLINNTDSIIFEIVTDTLFNLEKRKKFMKCLPEYFEGLSEHLLVINRFKEILDSTIANNENLYRIEPYTGVNEDIFCRRTFFYNNVFQPCSIGDEKNYNIISLSVMNTDEGRVEFYDVVNIPIKYAYNESTYKFQVIYPVIYKDIYLADIHFYFFK